MRVLQSTDGEVIALGFSPGGDALAAVVLPRGGVFLWNLQSGKSPVQIDTHASPFNRSLHFSPDGRRVAWLANHSRKVYDRDTRRVSEVNLDADGRVMEMAQTPDGTRLVTQHNDFKKPELVGWSEAGDGWEREWSIATGNLSVHTVAACPTGARIALLVRKAKPGERFWADPIRLELRSAVNGLVVASEKYPYGYRGPLLFSPDGTQLVGLNEMTLMAWPVPELAKEPRRIRNDSRKHFTEVAYHPNSRYLFATSNDTTVHVFDTRTWERAGRFTWNLGRLRSVAVSPDGALAAAGGDRGEVVVWDVDV